MLIIPCDIALFNYDCVQRNIATHEYRILKNHDRFG